MTETTKTIFEHYEVRKTKKQKRAFRDYVRTVCDGLGYSYSEEKGSFGAKNVIVGNPESARVIYTAHYDTCPVLPFPNFLTPKSFGIYLLYQIAIAFVIIAAMALTFFVVGFQIGFIAGMINMDPEQVMLISLLLEYLILIGFIYLMMAGPANRHTANDNTSGVTTLLDIMQALPVDERNSVAFIFFDLEELGLLGSMGYRSRHKRMTNNKLLINFDCVSDGDNIIFALRKKARPYESAISEAFVQNESVRVEVLTKGVFYPSDQMNFPAGVGAAAFKSTKRGLLYIDRIHTPRDTVYREENIDFLVNGAVKLNSILNRMEEK